MSYGKLKNFKYNNPHQYFAAARKYAMLHCHYVSVCISFTVFVIKGVEVEQR